MLLLRLNVHLQQLFNIQKIELHLVNQLLELQNTRFKLAELATKISVGRTYADRCVQLHCEKKLDGAGASAAKYFLSELQCEVADECVQLHGGYGYIWEYQVARSWQMHVYNEFMQVQMKL